MKTILATTNFSTAAGNAVNYAADMAVATNSKLMLYHAYSIPITTTDMPMDMSLIQEVEELSKNDLDALSKKIKSRLPSLAIAYKTSYGNVNGIEEMAASSNPDWMVMGLSRHRTLGRLLGNTVTSIISARKFPVLIVPEECHFTPFKKILFACDFTESYPPPNLKALIKMAKTFGVQVELLYSIDTNENSFLDMQYHPIVAKIRHEGISVRIHFVHFENLAEGIERYCKTYNVDLLVMAHHHHYFMEQLFEGSNAKKMIAHTHIPLLILPEYLKQTNE